MKELVIFDLDGTLVDTPTAIVETFSEVFAYLRVQPIEALAIRATIGLPLEQAFGQLLNLPVTDERVVLSLERYQIAFKEIVLPKAKKLIFPKVEEGLSCLRDQGFCLSIATSKFYRSADILLTAAGLREYFDLVVGADQVKQPKPHPEVGQLIMQKLGASPESTTMVGDTTHDLLMAKAAGMHSIAVTYGVHPIDKLRSVGPTFVADSFEEVVKYIASCAGQRS